MSTFNVGDIVQISSSSRPDDKSGEIVALRHAVGNTRTGSLSFGADVLLPSGRTCFFFLHDIARWNPDKIAAASAHPAAQRLAMKLFLVTPPDINGGNDSDTLVAAEDACRAVGLVQESIDGRCGPHKQVSDEEWNNQDDIFLARELPRATQWAGIIDWSHAAFTFWMPLDL